MNQLHVRAADFIAGVGEEWWKDNVKVQDFSVSGILYSQFERATSIVPPSFLVSEPFVGEPGEFPLKPSRYFLPPRLQRHSYPTGRWCGGRGAGGLPGGVGGGGGGLCGCGSGFGGSGLCGSE